MTGVLVNKLHSVFGMSIVRAVLATAFLFVCLSVRPPVCPSHAGLWRRDALCRPRQAFMLAQWPQCHNATIPLRDTCDLWGVKVKHHWANISCFFYVESQFVPPPARCRTGECPIAPSFPPPLIVSKRLQDDAVFCGDIAPVAQMYIFGDYEFHQHIRKGSPAHPLT